MPRLREPIKTLKKEELFEAPPPEKEKVETEATSATPVIEKKPEVKEPEQDEASLALKKQLDKIRESEALVAQYQRERDEAIKRAREQEVALAKRQREAVQSQYESVAIALKAAKEKLEFAKRDIRVASDAGDKEAELAAFERLAEAKNEIMTLEPGRDPVMEIIEKAGVVPKNVLEIGCGNGWRLDELGIKYGCNTWGVEPSARENHPYIYRGTANALYNSTWTAKFDLVIYGFCLYLVDREDLFDVVAEGDRVLQDGGYLVIHDFVPLWSTFKRKYKHRDSVFSYHMDYSKLWLANPAYSLYGIATNNPTDEVGAIMLKKDIEKGWPLHD